MPQFWLLGWIIPDASLGMAFGVYRSYKYTGYRGA